MRRLLGILLALLIAAGAEAQTVPLFPKASDIRQGFLRIINPHGNAGVVTITAYTDTGEQRETSFSFEEGEEVKHFNSDDLEYGNSAKGIVGIGSRDSDWRLEFTTDLTLVIPAYMRTKTDGFLTSLHETVTREEDGTYGMHTFNPGSNTNQRSILRLVNTTETPATATVTGTDDSGAAGIMPVPVTLIGNGAVQLSAQWLEDRGLGSFCRQAVFHAHD